MIAKTKLSEYDHAHYNSDDRTNRRSARNMRRYFDQKFGHGFWHVILNTVPRVAFYYHKDINLDNEIFNEIMSIVSRRVNLPIDYLVEEFNLFRFKN